MLDLTLKRIRMQQREREFLKAQDIKLEKLSD